MPKGYIHLILKFNCNEFHKEGITFIWLRDCFKVTKGIEELQIFSMVVSGLYCMHHINNKDNKLYKLFDSFDRI